MWLQRYLTLSEALTIISYTDCNTVLKLSEKAERHILGHILKAIKHCFSSFTSFVQ